MQKFTYQVFKTLYRPKQMLIKDEYGETIFFLNRQSHKILAQILNAILRSGLPYTYSIAEPDGKAVYVIDCRFPGFRYLLVDHVSSESVKIVKSRVQLMETAYSFRLNEQDYYFDKDFAGTGHLKCNGKEIGAVSMSNRIINSKLDVIHVQAIDKAAASLSAVLFHTFFYYNA
ncbi:hypothetical protein FQV26_09355 [Planococcus sp. CPCC 101016]|uniref:tubby C-terminal domain-like protein n=1 Tax=Planococcus sp. CPCC 101016 TaxID=2599617 RepID=UPI0011B49161|nr:hypothetical protein [Planococcus sp. CPCC 101016]TWT07997.1 hypothetical protein FQV26_09355 [Planococcus sp. CPCC 101016]